jgi:hypothetical protein
VYFFTTGGNGMRTNAFIKDDAIVISKIKEKKKLT